ncbi:hypothetical protein J3E68DRAFT_398779 [Trichoderma sp. SZMC 28012]
MRASRLLAMILGRPSTIPTNLVDMDLPTCHQFSPAAEAIRDGESTSDSISSLSKPCTCWHRASAVLHSFLTSLSPVFDNEQTTV